MRIILCWVLTLSVAALAASPLKGGCIQPNLLGRTEALPRSPPFALGAAAFDRATADWYKRRYLEAARGFMSASAHFATAGEEGNWEYAWKNAALAFAAAGKIDEGKAAFEAAAVADAPHAEALRAAGAALTARGACP